MAKERLAFGCHFGNPRKWRLGDDEDVHGCLRRDVVDGDALRIFMRNSCRDLAVDDLLEKSLGHGEVLAVHRSVSRRNRLTWARQRRSSKKEKIETGGSRSACGRERADEENGFLVVALASRCLPPIRGHERGAKVCDQER